MLELGSKGYIDGRIILPGSKSISNRLLILQETTGTSMEILGISDAEDTRLLQKALTTYRAGTSRLIDIGDAGTDMRFLTALLSTREGEWMLTGSARMKERPIAPLVLALQKIGADISYLEKEGFPPLKISGKKLKGGQIEIDGSLSSQFISAILLSAPGFEKGVEIEMKGKTVSRPYITMTLALMREVGIQVEHSDNYIRVLPFCRTAEKKTFQVESDWSAASYWFSMCALAKKAEIELSFLNTLSLQADSVLPGLYEKLGVRTEFRQGSVLLSKSAVQTNFFEYDFTDCPDIAQTLAVTCFGLGIEARLTGLRTLKIKETDRLLALQGELEKLGALVEVDAESIYIQRKQKNVQPKGPLLTYNDHRMAMSFAPLVLLYSTLLLDNPNVVNKSYPDFWRDLKSVGFSVNLQPN